jgi:hypothetical protein
VSSNFYTFRDVMIDLYQKERGKAAMDQLSGADNAASQKIWTKKTVTENQWNNRISGTFWLVRPDERTPPVPYMP